MKKPLSEEEFTSWVKKMDLDGDGKVTVEELARCMAAESQVRTVCP